MLAQGVLVGLLLGQLGLDGDQVVGQCRELAAQREHVLEVEGVQSLGPVERDGDDAARALLFAGVVMLFFNPLLLAYDPGFQLSFIATLGLIFGAPIVEAWFRFMRPAFMREVAASTVAAQIAVLPLLLYQNGLFSIVALPANLLVLPVVPAAMLFSAIAGFAGLLAPVIAPLVGFPAYLLLGYITHLVSFAAALPLASVSLPAFPFTLVLLAYALLGYGAYRGRKS